MGHMPDTIPKPVEGIDLDAYRGAFFLSVDAVGEHGEAYIGYAVDEPEEIWFLRLVEEVGELSEALRGDHEHPPELELTQIAGICTNWLALRWVEARKQS